MSAPNTSEALTDGIRVSVVARHQSEQRSALPGKHVFTYRVTIANESDRVARVLGREWVIIDGDGHRRETRGSGIVGQQPAIHPGESHSYTSLCTMPTTWGTMEGALLMERPDGRRFRAEVARFHLFVEQPARQTSTA